MFQPGMYINAKEVTEVMVYVHNVNQECYNLSAISN